MSVRQSTELIYYVVGIAILFIFLITAKYIELLVSLGLLFLIYYLQRNYTKIFFNKIIDKLTREYRFNQDKDIVTYEKEGNFVSIAAIECYLKDSGINKESLEKILNTLEFELKIILRVQKIDVSEYLDWLKEERSKLEYKKSVLEDENKALNFSEIASIERKISHYNAMINRIASGEKPYFFRYIFIVESTAKDYVEAINNLEARLTSIRKLIDSLFSGNSKRLKGYDLYDAIF
ncbi:MAG: hypothetical protein QXJ06_00690 [Candidatus Aenigmatarchaeota archaeon]